MIVLQLKTCRNIGGTKKKGRERKKNKKNLSCGISWLPRVFFADKESVSCAHSIYTVLPNLKTINFDV